MQVLRLKRMQKEIFISCAAWVCKGIKLSLVRGLFLKRSCLWLNGWPTKFNLTEMLNEKLERVENSRHVAPSWATFRLRTRNFVVVQTFDVYTDDDVNGDSDDDAVVQKTFVSRLWWTLLLGVRALVGWLNCQTEQVKDASPCSSNISSLN